MKYEKKELPIRPCKACEIKRKEIASKNNESIDNKGDEGNSSDKSGNN